MLRLQDKIKYKFEMCGHELIEDATVTNIEKEKVYCKDAYGTKLIFDKDTNECLTDNTTFGAKRTLIG